MKRRLEGKKDMGQWQARPTRPHQSLYLNEEQVKPSEHVTCGLLDSLGEPHLLRFMPYDSSPFECGWTRWLASNEQNTGVMRGHF